MPLPLPVRVCGGRSFPGDGPQLSQAPRRTAGPREIWRPHLGATGDHSRWEHWGIERGRDWPRVTQGPGSTASLRSWASCPHPGLLSRCHTACVSCGWVKGSGWAEASSPGGWIPSYQPAMVWGPVGSSGWWVGGLHGQGTKGRGLGWPAAPRQDEGELCLNSAQCISKCCHREDGLSLARCAPKASENSECSALVSAGGQGVGGGGDSWGGTAQRGEGPRGLGVGSGKRVSLDT